MKQQRSSSTSVATQNTILKLLDKLNREARQHRALLAKILFAVDTKRPHQHPKGEEANQLSLSL
jgi:hypothetical protein